MLKRTLNDLIPLFVYFFGLLDRYRINDPLCVTYLRANKDHASFVYDYFTF